MAPDAVNVTAVPLHIAIADAAMDVVGVVVTLIETVCVDEQVPLLPVTEYVVVTVGDAVAVVVITPPAFALHVNDGAPDAVKVTADPLQIAVADGAIDTVGVVATVTDTVFVSVQVPFAPTTV